MSASHPRPLWLTPISSIMLLLVSCGTPTPRQDVPSGELPSSSSTPEQNHAKLDELGYRTALDAYHGARAVQTFHLTHDALMSKGEKVSIPTRTGTKDVLPYLEPVDALLGAIQPPEGSPGKDTQGVLVLRVGAGASYEQFAWTMFALSKRKRVISTLFVSSGEGQYHVVPLIFPKLSIAGETYPDVTIHHSEGCDELTLNRLSAEYGALTTCITTHELSTRTRLKLYAHASSNTMLHSFMTPEELPDPFKMCVANVFHDVSMPHTIPKACRPSLIFSLHTTGLRPDYMWVNMMPQGLQAGHQGAYITRCNKEDWPAQFCMDATQHAQSEALINAWYDALTQKSVHEASKHLKALKAIWHFPTLHTWIKTYHATHKEPTILRPINITLTALDPAMPMSLMLHIISQLYQDKEILWWDEAWIKKSPFTPPTWAISM